MACKNKRSDYRSSVIGEDDKNGKTVIEKFVLQKKRSKLCTMFNEFEPWDKEGDDLEEKNVKLQRVHAALESDSLIERYIVDWSSRVVRTIGDLSGRLASASEKNCNFRNRDEIQKFEIDRLRAMIRISSGNDTEYRERVVELNNIVVRVDRDTDMLKRIIRNPNSCENFSVYHERMRSVETMINELLSKLKNDEEAMLATEVSRLSDCKKKIAELQTRSNDLLREVKKILSESRARSCGIESSETPNYPKVIDEMEMLVKRLAIELKTLRSVPTRIGTRIGGESSVKYLKRIRKLEKFVASSVSIIDKLIIDSKELSAGEKTSEDLDYVRVFSNNRDSIVALEVLAKKLKSGFEELEISVAAGDGTNLIRRIRETERTLRGMRNAVDAREKKNRLLSLELTGAKIAYGEKVEALEKLQKKYERLSRRTKKRGIDLEIEDKKLANLVRELEESKSKASETKNLRDQLNALTTEVANMRSERSALLEETSRMTTIIEERNNRLANVAKQKKTIERTLTREKDEATKSLVSAMKDMKSLMQDNSDLKNKLESALQRPVCIDATIDCQIDRVEIEESAKEIQRLSALLDETAENLEDKNKKFVVLSNDFIELNVEKTKIELELLRVKSQNAALIVNLNSEKAATSETLQNYDKLMNDFQLLNNDFESLKIERTCIRSDLEDSKRQEVASRDEIDELRRQNVVLLGDSSSLKARLNDLSRELEESIGKNVQFNEQLNRLNEKTIEQSMNLDSLTKENEDLKDKLDTVRSDKLNIAGSLNDARLKYEESNNQLNEKTRESRDLQERLRDMVRDREESKAAEISAKLEVARLLDENASLRVTIDVSSADKTSFENKLRIIDNEYRDLKNQLADSENEKKTLMKDSSMLEREIDRLIKDLKGLTTNDENDTRQSESIVAEREETTNIVQRKFVEFEIVHENLRNVLARLRDDNASLKRDGEIIAAENEKMRLRSDAKRNDRSDRSELKLESTRLRVANGEIDRFQPVSAKDELTKMRDEISSLCTENRTMRMIVKKIGSANAKLEEERNFLRIDNDALRRDIDDAKKSIPAIETLKKDTDLWRTRCEKLGVESSDLKKSLECTKFEHQALRQEIDILRSTLKRVNDDNARRRMDFAERDEELVALKGELSRLREENDALRSEVDDKRTEYCRLESEEARLKDELEELKRARILADEEANAARNEHEKLKVLKFTVERKLMDALVEIDKYTVATAKLNDLENKLKWVLKDYVVTKKLLRTSNDELNHLRRIAEQSCIRSLEYGEKISAT